MILEKCRQTTRIVDRKKFLPRVIETLHWMIAIEEGEFIESRNYHKTHMSFSETIAQTDLNSICDVVNMVLEFYSTDRRIVNSMGELMPTHVR